MVIFVFLKRWFFNIFVFMVENDKDELREMCYMKDIIVFGFFRIVYY